MEIYDLIVIGGGPAGMAAACAAKEHGLSDILMLERGSYLGGVLPQCIHDGFGVFEFGESMTGPEYAVRWKHLVEEHGIKYMLNAMVVEAGKSAMDSEGFESHNVNTDSLFKLTVSSLDAGVQTLYARTIIMATGCRERTLGQLRIPGGRPAGIMTAGAAQYMMNVKNYLPGRSAVILGSGDVGLIMARRLTLEGVQVKMIIGERASGLMRNYVQCVSDYGIPLRFGYTVSKVAGRRRLTGVTVNRADENGNPIGKGQYIHCDTLIVAAGMIPERDIFDDLNAPGAFFCGNVYKSYDTVDAVTVSGRNAGKAAAEYVRLYSQINIETEKFDAYKISDNRKIVVDEIDVDALNESRRLTPEDEEILAHNLSLGDTQYIYCTVCPKGCRIAVRRVSAEQSEKDKVSAEKFVLGKSDDDMKNINADEQKVLIEGFSCENGKAFALQELKAPMRVVTSTVKVFRSGADDEAAGIGDSEKKNCCGECALLPVKTDSRVPKNLVGEVIDICRNMIVHINDDGNNCKNIENFRYSKEDSNGRGGRTLESCAYINCGDIIVENVCDTGVNIISCGETNN